MTGVELIAAERKRQIMEEGWTAQHDKQHTDGSLAIAAVCYATPERIYCKDEFDRGLQFIDPWPWDHRWDKRFDYGERKKNHGNVPPDPQTYAHSERVDLLIKAGALIAAEIDRLQALEKNRLNKKPQDRRSGVSEGYGPHGDSGT